MKTLKGHIHHFKGGEVYEVLTPIFDITPHTTYVEFTLPDGRFIYYEFNNNHTIRERTIWNFVSGKGIPDESIQGTYQAQKK